MITVTISMLCLIHPRILENNFPGSALSWEFCYIYLRWRIYYATAPELYQRSYWYVCASYSCVCDDIFLHIITVSVLLCLCMFYNIIVGYTSYWFFLYLSYAWVIPPLCYCYICVFNNTFVNIVSMFTVIFLFTS